LLLCFLLPCWAGCGEETRPPAEATTSAGDESPGDTTGGTDSTTGEQPPGGDGDDDGGIPSVMTLTSFFPNANDRLGTTLAYSGTELGDEVQLVAGAPGMTEGSGGGVYFNLDGTDDPRQLPLFWVWGSRFGRSLIYADGSLLASAENFDGAGELAVFEEDFEFDEEGMWQLEQRYAGRFDSSKFASATAFANGRLYVADADSRLCTVAVFERGEGGGWTRGDDAVSAGAVDILAASGDRLAFGFNLFPRRHTFTVLEVADGTWEELGGASFDNDNPIRAMAFISDDELAVGTAGLSTDESPGDVRIYRRGTSAWLLVQTLEAPLSTGVAGFGARLAVAGDTLFVAAPGTPNGGAGAVYRFDRGTEETFQYTDALAPANSHDGDRFGTSLAVGSRYLWVGAPYSDASGERAGGAVFAFPLELAEDRTGE